MALQYELIDNDTRIHHWSNIGHYLLQVDTGIDTYEDAVDNYPTEHYYEETDVPIPLTPDEDEPIDEGGDFV